MAPKKKQHFLEIGGENVNKKQKHSRKISRILTILNFKMYSEENSQPSSEISIKEENDNADCEDIIPSKIFDCKFPEMNNQPPEYFFETDHVKMLISNLILKRTLFSNSGCNKAQV